MLVSSNGKTVVCGATNFGPIPDASTNERRYIMTFYKGNTAFEFTAKNRNTIEVDIVDNKLYITIDPHNRNWDGECPVTIVIPKEDLKEFIKEIVALADVVIAAV